MHTHLSGNMRDYRIKSPHYTTAHTCTHTDTHTHIPTQIWLQLKGIPCLVVPSCGQCCQIKESKLTNTCLLVAKVYVYSIQHHCNRCRNAQVVKAMYFQPRNVNVAKRALSTIHSHTSTLPVTFPPFWYSIDRRKPTVTSSGTRA